MVNPRAELNDFLCSWRIEFVGHNGAQSLFLHLIAIYIESCTWHGFCGVQLRDYKWEAQVHTYNCKKLGELHVSYELCGVTVQKVVPLSLTYALL